MTEGNNQPNTDHREKLMDYLYQEPGPSEARAFEQHLEACEACAKDLADFQQVRQLVSSWELEGVPHISVTVDPGPTTGWLAQFSALPIWMRLMTAAAAALLLLSVFNVRISFSPSDGLAFSASLFPQPDGVPPVRPQLQPPGLTVEQVRTLIENSLSRVEAKTNQQLAAQLVSMSSEIGAKNQQALANLAQSLRREQEARLGELLDQTENSYDTLTLYDLFSGETSNGY